MIYDRQQKWIKQFFLMIFQNYNYTKKFNVIGCFNNIYS